MNQKKSFIDEDWTGFSHEQIKSMIIQEEEEQECKADGHNWMPAIYCKTCGEDFNQWQQHVEERTAFSLLLEDLPNILNGMLSEKFRRMKKRDTDFIRERMMGCAYERGYFKHAKQQ